MKGSAGLLSTLIEGKLIFTIMLVPALRYTVGSWAVLIFKFVSNLKAETPRAQLQM